MRPSSESTSRVWIIDDDAQFRAMVAEASTLADLQIDGFDPAELTERLRSGDGPDGIMLDGGIRPAEGSENLLQVARVVLCSGRSLSELPDQWIRRPNVRVLLKPFTLDQLLLSLRWLAIGEEVTGWETPLPGERSAPLAPSR